MPCQLSKFLSIHSYKPCKTTMGHDTFPSLSHHSPSPLPTIHLYLYDIGSVRGDTGVDQVILPSCGEPFATVSKLQGQHTGLMETKLELLWTRNMQHFHIATFHTVCVGRGDVYIYASDYNIYVIINLYMGEYTSQYIKCITCKGVDNFTM